MKNRILISLSRWFAIGDRFDDDERCHYCGRDAWEIDHQLRRVWPAGCVCIDERDCQAEQEGIPLVHLLVDGAPVGALRAVH